MKKRTVLKNQPVRLPILSTIVIAHLLDYYKVDGIYWGIFITLYSIYWIVAIAVKWNDKYVDLDDYLKKNDE